jgi:hypothetical protein
MGSSAQYLVHTNYDTSISIEPISKHIKKKWLPMQCPVKFKEELQTNVRKRNVISYAYPQGIKCVPGRHARIKASKKIQVQVCPSTFSQIPETSSANQMPPA